MPEPIPFLLFGDFALHSGGRSQFIVDSRAIFACEPLREFVLNRWVEEIEHLKAVRPDRPDRIQVHGVPGGGVPWAEALAQRIRATPVPRAMLDPTYPVVAVDDVVTTGASLMEVAANTRLAVVDRGYNARIVSVWHMPLPLEAPDAPR